MDLRPILALLQSLLRDRFELRVHRESRKDASSLFGVGKA